MFLLRLMGQFKDTPWMFYVEDKMECEDCGGEMKWNYFDRKNMCVKCGNEIQPLGEVRKEGNKQRTIKEYIK